MKLNVMSLTVYISWSPVWNWTSQINLRGLISKTVSFAGDYGTIMEQGPALWIKNTPIPTQRET